MEDPRPQHLSYRQTLGVNGISVDTYPFGPNWGSVKPYKAAEFCAPKHTSGQDPLQFTTRRLTFQRPPSAFDAGTLRYPETYVPPSITPNLKKLRLTVKFKGAGMDGVSVLVTVSARGTVAEVITSAVEQLKHTTGHAVSYGNLRVTGLFSESGRPLSAGFRLHSQGQVPFVRDGGVLVLKVLP